MSRIIENETSAPVLIHNSTSIYKVLKSYAALAFPVFNFLLCIGWDYCYIVKLPTDAPGNYWSYAKCRGEEIILPLLF